MLLEKLEQGVNFTNHEKDVARYILDHPDKAPGMSSAELAEASFTSKATVVRLCKKLGLSGYQEFRLKLVEEINQKTGSPGCLRASRSMIKAPIRILSIRCRASMIRL